MFAVPCTFIMNFVVFELSIPTKNGSAVKTFHIVDPCDSGQVLCSDSNFSSVGCSVRYPKLMSAVYRSN